MEPLIRVVTESWVHVTISSDCRDFLSEKKFAKDLTVFELKGKLELITGAPCMAMRLEVYDDSDKSNKVKVCELQDDNALLGSYPVDSGMRIHVIDLSGKSREFDNLSSTEKYDLTPEQYASRQDTVQNYLKRNKLGKYNEQEMKKLQEEKEKQLAEELRLAQNIQVGQRCQVLSLNNLPRRGTVRYVGEVHFKPGQWVGVEYDEPLGKNDGSVDGKRYFECRSKYGGLVSVHSVQTGDFPEEELRLTDDEDEM